MSHEDDRPKEAFFVFLQGGKRPLVDFTYAFTAENARRMFAADFDVPVDMVGAFPLDESDKGVQRIMASKGQYFSHNPGAKTPKLAAKSSHPKKAGKGKGSTNKGRKTHIV